MTDIIVTPEQVLAARIEVQAMRSAGLEPDPLLLELSEAVQEVVPDEHPADGGAGDEVGALVSAADVADGHLVTFELPPGYRLLTPEEETSAAADRGLATNRARREQEQRALRPTRQSQSSLSVVPVTKPPWNMPQPSRARAADKPTDPDMGRDKT